MTKLFDDIERVNVDPATNNQNIFDFYNKSAKSEIITIRNQLEKWFFEFPENEKKELKSRFKKEFHSAFYELFIYHLFKGLGFSLTIHPKAPNSSHRPDFLAKKGNIEIYVEAKIDTDKSKQEKGFENRKNQLLDSFSNLKIKGFYLNLERIEFKTSNQPKTKDLIVLIERKFNSLNHEKVLTKIETYGIGGIEQFTFETKDVLLVISPIPVDRKYKDKVIKRPIGMQSMGTHSDKGEQSLRKSIDKKAKRYGILDKPFIICINALSDKFPTIRDFNDVIWGSIALQYSDNPNDNSTKYVRLLDGVFKNKKGPRIKNVSGILITRVVPFSIPNSEYWLFKHPFTENSIDFNKIGLPYNYVDKTKIYENTGTNLDEIFNIDKNWLT